MKTISDYSKTVIRPEDPWWLIDWRELYSYRDLIWFLVRRDFVSEYKQTILGPLWGLLQPLGATIVFTIIFGKLAKLQTDELPPILFYNSGLLLWTYLQGCQGDAARTLSANASIFQKVYFPRLIGPFVGAIGKLWQLLINSFLFLGFFFYFLLCTNAMIKPNLFVLWFPGMVLQTAFLGMGVGMLIAGLTVRYRDLRFAVPILVQVWMYTTPIVYPASMVSEKWRWVLWLNPFASVVELNRYAFTGAGAVTVSAVLVGWLLTLLVFLAGLFVFNKVQQTFVDTI